MIIKNRAFNEFMIGIWALAACGAVFNATGDIAIGLIAGIGSAALKTAVNQLLRRM